MFIKLFGNGAAGNKAAIEAINTGVIARENVVLLNTTDKDVDPEYKDIFIQISNSLRGCGKERSKAKAIISNFLQSDQADKIDNFLSEGKPDMIVLATSTSGGSGSGITALLGKYIKDVFGISVHVVAFTGFENDPRELQNTVEFFQDLTENLGVEAISNKKFLSSYNIIGAEQQANKEFCCRLSILKGDNIRDSIQNIDDTDLLKLSTTPGYMTIERVMLPNKIKNSKLFEGAVIAALDESKSLDTSVGCHRFGVILNCSKDELEFIDTNMTFVRERYGIPYESFLHIQHEDDLPSFVDIVIAGMKLPIEEVQSVYKKYQTMTKQVNVEKDSFFSVLSECNTQSDMFDMSQNRQVRDKKSFFAGVNEEDTLKSQF